MAKNDSESKFKTVSKFCKLYLDKMHAFGNMLQAEK